MNKKAQNFTELALLLGVVTLALVAMQPYFKRGINAIVRNTSDDLGSYASKEFKTNYGQDVDPQVLGGIQEGFLRRTVTRPRVSTSAKEVKVGELGNTSSGDLRELRDIKKDDTSTSFGETVVYAK